MPPLRAALRSLLGIFPPGIGGLLRFYILSGFVGRENRFHNSPANIEKTSNLLHGLAPLCQYCLN